MCVCVCVCSCLRVRKNVNLRKSAAAPRLREEGQAVLNPPPAGGIPVPGILGCGDESFACDYCPPGPRVGFGSGPSGSRVFWCWPLFCCCSSSSFPPLSSFSTSPFSPLWTEDLILLVIEILLFFWEKGRGKRSKQYGKGRGKRGRENWKNSGML